jgi:3-oxoacyl-(acyl-carrier-protein) synthase
VCEEVKFGIPRQAWFIGLLGAAAVLMAALAVMLLQPHLLPRKSNDQAKKPS